MLNAIDTLLTRVSAGRLVEPAPTDAELRTLFQAAFRAPDHKRLRPWRFLTIQGSAREALGAVFADALALRGTDRPSAAKLEAERAKPLRAPLIIVVAAQIDREAGILPGEQILTAGAAAQNILLGAHAMGYGGVWKTGAPAYDPFVKHALGLHAADEIVAFLYLGTLENPTPPAPAVEAAAYVTEWTGPQPG